MLLIKIYIIDYDNRHHKGPTPNRSRAMKRREIVLPTLHTGEWVGLYDAILAGKIIPRKSLVYSYLSILIAPAF